MAKLKKGQVDYTKKSQPKRKLPGKRRNKINFSQERAQSIIERIDADINMNYPVFYTGGQIYLHRNVRNFKVASVKINKEINNQISTLVSAFRSDAQTLIKICEDNETRFLSTLNNKMRTLDARFKPYTRDSFRTLFNQHFQSTISVELTSLNGALATIPKGKKTIAQLRQLADWYQRLEQMVKSLQLNNYLDGEFLTSLEQRNANIQANFINSLPPGLDEALSTLPGSSKKIKEMVAGLSTGSANLYFLPTIVEALIAQNLDALSEVVVGKKITTNVKMVGKDTSQGTSGDVEALGVQFSVKMNQRDLKQTKNRQLQTFFDWNADLNQPIIIQATKQDEYLNSLQTAMSNNNLIPMIQYLLMNYANLTNSDISTLETAIQVIALSGLNEKIFGYNKKRQNQIFANIIDKLPIAVINSRGDIVYMKDLMVKIIAKIDQDFNNIKAMAKVTINKTRINVQNLNAKKKAALGQIPGKYKYVQLKQMVTSELAQVTNQLLSAIKINVAYKIHYDDVLNEIMK